MDGSLLRVVHLEGSSDRKGHFWLVLDGGTADLCVTDPGHDVDLEVAAHTATMVDYWMGRTDFADAVGRGELTVQGPARLARALPTWFRRSAFATVPLP